MMADHEKTKEELIAEIERLRQRAAAADGLEARLAALLRENAELEKRFSILLSASTQE